MVLPIGPGKLIHWRAKCITTPRAFPTARKLCSELNIALSHVTWALNLNEREESTKKPNGVWQTLLSQRYSGEHCPVIWGTASPSFPHGEEQNIASWGLQHTEHQSPEEGIHDFWILPHTCRYGVSHWPWMLQPERLCAGAPLRLVTPEFGVE